MQTIYYSFYQRELIIKIAVYPPPLCVSLCLFFFISVVKKNVQKVEMYPGLSVFIYENNFFFLSLSECDIWLV